MAKANISVDQEQFSCPICLDLLKDPVALPCGHSFCMGCITSRWDWEDQNGVYSCRQCTETFTPRPLLRRNNMLADIIETFKISELQSPSGDDSFAGPGDVACDSCTGRKYKAVKSCLFCLASYCVTHLQPHYQSLAFKKHKLTEVSSRLQENVCSLHDKMFEIYCRTDKRCICSLCLLEEHKSHDTVSVKAERTKKLDELTVDQKNIQQRIKEKQMKVQELKKAISTIKRSAQSVTKDNEKIFADAISCIAKKCAEVRKLISDQERAEVSEAEQLLQQLELEIADLTEKSTELQRLLITQDHIRFLQSFQSLSVSSGCENSPGFTVNQINPLDELNKSLMKLKTQFEEFCKKELEKIPPRAAAMQMIVPSKQKRKKHTITQCSRLDPPSTTTQEAQRKEMVLPAMPKERKDFLKYFGELTLDPNTIHQTLRLSEENKMVKVSESEGKYPLNPERFDYWRQVLCKEPVFGCCYWEVEWNTVGNVCLSVSYEGISRKGQSEACKFGYNNSSWSLECSSSSLTFCHDGVKTKVQGSPCSRVGVYVDHSAGVLSFYSVSDDMRLLHCVQTTFTEPLYAGFWIGFKSTLRLCDKQ